jgi:uncharacterized protein Usg
MVSDHKQALHDYRLTTAEIIYHLPDHPDLLQSFIWQKMDVAPDFPELRRFLEYWSRNIEGKLHSVRVGQARLARKATVPPRPYLAPYALDCPPGPGSRNNKL